MTAAGRSDRALAHAVALVVRFGPSGALAVVRARITAGLDALCDARFRALYGAAPRDRRPLGLTS